MQKSGLVGRGSVVGAHYSLVHILCVEWDIREGAAGGDRLEVEH